MLYGLPIIKYNLHGSEDITFELNSALQLVVNDAVIDTPKCLDLYRYLKYPTTDLYEIMFALPFFECSLIVDGFQYIDEVFYLSVREATYWGHQSYPSIDPRPLNSDTIKILKKMLEIHLGDLVNGL